MDRFTSIVAFVRFAEQGGFTAAARHLNLSTATISGQVQALEDSLGVRLLNRTTRKVSLTDIGREYYERCAQILHELDEADELANALQLAPRGKLRVHCNPSMVRFIAPVVAAYLRDNPDVSVDLYSGYQMIDLLEEGFDLAIRASMPPDSSFMARQLASWHHVLCCAPSYLETHDPPRSPADLVNHNCIRFAFYPLGDEWHFTDRAGQSVSVRVAGNLVTTSIDMLHAAALAGDGLLLVPPFIIHSELETGALVPLLTNYRTVDFSIVAIYPHRRHLAAKVRLFIDALVALFAGHEWSQANSE
jgi:DNA-binding transcriptional LysR family regulator